MFDVPFKPIFGYAVGKIVGGSALAANPEIVVEESDVNVSDGGALAFTNSPVDIPAVKTFTIRNTGDAVLSGLVVTKNGTHSAQFAVGALGATSLAKNASTTFTVTFTPTSVGAKTAAIHIANNDTDENPFDVNLSGLCVAVNTAIADHVAASSATDVEALTALMDYIWTENLFDHVRVFPFKAAQNKGSGTTVYGLGGWTDNHATLAGGTAWGAEGVAFDAVNAVGTVTLPDLAILEELYVFDVQTPVSASVAFEQHSGEVMLGDIQYSHYAYTGHGAQMIGGETLCMGTNAGTSARIGTKEAWGAGESLHTVSRFAQTGSKLWRGKTDISTLTAGNGVDFRPISTGWRAWAVTQAVPENLIDVLTINAYRHVAFGGTWTQHFHGFVATRRQALLLCKTALTQLQRETITDLLAVVGQVLDASVSAHIEASGATDTAGLVALMTYVRAQGLFNDVRVFPFKTAQNKGSGDTVYGLGGWTSNNVTTVNNPIWTPDGMVFTAADTQRAWADMTGIAGLDVLHVFDAQRPGGSSPDIQRYGILGVGSHAAAKLTWFCCGGPCEMTGETMCMASNKDNARIAGNGAWTKGGQHQFVTRFAQTGSGMWKGKAVFNNMAQGGTDFRPSQCGWATDSILNINAVYADPGYSNLSPTTRQVLLLCKTDLTQLQRETITDLITALAYKEIPAVTDWARTSYWTNSNVTGEVSRKVQITNNMAATVDLQYYNALMSGWYEVDQTLDPGETTSAEYRYSSGAGNRCFVWADLEGNSPQTVFTNAFVIPLRLRIGLYGPEFTVNIPVPEQSMKVTYDGYGNVNYTRGEYLPVYQVTIAANGDISGAVA